MISKIKTAKQSVIQLFSLQTLKNFYERIRWKNMSRRRRITFVTLITLIPSLAIIVGILVSCIYGVDYHTNAIAINDSTQRFEGQDYYNNQVMFLTLATRLKKFPSGYFQIYFSDQQISEVTNYPSINVRTSQGTPLKVDLFVTARLNISNHRAFYQKYGDDWMTFLKIKIQNIIIRAISNIGFYQLTSKTIRSQTQTILSSFDEFIVNIVNIGVQLPGGYLSNVNGTIGWNMFQKYAQLVMLNQTYATLNSYNSAQAESISQQFTTWGQLQAQKQIIILNNSFTNVITSSDTYWSNGMNSLTAFATSVNSTNANNITKQLLWYYFQSYYNSSFNTMPYQVQFN